MAKTDTFFLRETCNIDNDNSYQQVSIDLGTYVNALEKSVLRIKSVQVAFTDSTGRSNSIVANGQAKAQFQLLTQSKSDIVLPSDPSTIATGQISVANRLAAQSIGGIVSHDYDVGPTVFNSEGYLVAVDTIYLGGAASTDFAGNVYCSVTLECQVESLTTTKAMALALSQQGQ